MAGHFKIYRFLCSTPPDLESERVVFESTLQRFGEQATFPQQVLFAGASFRPGFDANLHRASAEANVRMCDFSVHVFGETWPQPAFKAFIDLAIVCRADPSQPMRGVAVLFRSLAGADDKVRQFRDTLAEGGKCDLRDFRDSAELESQLRELFASWWEPLRPIL